MVTKKNIQTHFFFGTSSRDIVAEFLNFTNCCFGNIPMFNVKLCSKRLFVVIIFFLFIRRTISIIPFVLLPSRPSNTSDHQVNF